MKKEPSQYEIFNNFHFFGFNTKEELIEKYINNDIDDFIKQQIDFFIQEEDELGFHVSTTTDTKIIKSVDEERYTIFSNGGYTIVQNYSFFNDFEKYGFDTKEDFILYIGKTDIKEIPTKLRKMMAKEKEAIEKKRKKKRQIEGYKEKLRAERLMRLRKQVEKEYPDLPTREKEKLVFRLYDSHNAVSYKWLKRLDDAEKEALRKKFLLSKNEILQILEKMEMPSHFDTFNDARKYISNIDISQYLKMKTNGFDKCPIFKDNRSIIIPKNEHYRMVSIDYINKIAYVFDFIDLLALYDINTDDIIKIKQIIIKKAEEIKEGRQKLEDEKTRYQNFFDYVTSNKFKQEYPTLHKYIEKHIPTLKAVVNIGIENINNTLYFKENKAVFFASSRYIAKKENISYQNVAKKINLFCVLGFFRKVFKKELPEVLEYENNKEYSINYLQLCDIDFKKAEEIAKLLIDSKVSIKNFTKKNIANVLGIEIAGKVFQRRKTKEEKAPENKDNVFEEAFVEDFENELDILRERDIEDTFEELEQANNINEYKATETGMNRIVVITNNPEQLEKGSIVIGDIEYVFVPDNEGDDDDVPF